MLGLCDSLSELKYFEADGLDGNNLVGVDVDLFLVAILICERFFQIKFVDGEFVILLDNRSIVATNFLLGLGFCACFSFSASLSFSACLSFSAGLGFCSGFSFRSDLGFSRGRGFSLCFSLCFSLGFSRGLRIGLCGNFGCGFNDGLSGYSCLCCNFYVSISTNLNSLSGTNERGKSKNKFHDL